MNEDTSLIQALSPIAGIEGGLLMSEVMNWLINEVSNCIY